MSAEPGPVLAIFVLPALLGMAVVLHFMRRIYIRCLQVYLVRPGLERRPFSYLARFAYHPVLPVLLGALAAGLALRAVSGVESQPMASFLALSAGLAWACTGLFSELGLVFLCTEGVEWFMREPGSRRRSSLLFHLSVLAPLCALALVILALRRAPSLTSAESEAFLQAILVFSLFSVGAFLSGFLASRVKEPPTSRTGFRKKLAGVAAGQAAVMAGLAAALMILRGGNIL